MSQAEIPTRPAKPSGLLLSRDLIFTSKILGTAGALGHPVAVASTPSMALHILAIWQPIIVFVDLGAGDLVEAASLVQYREVTGPGTPFLAFGSHVDTRALADAAAAGCDPVMPRSRFTVELPALIRRYFGEG